MPAAFSSDERRTGGHGPPLNWRYNALQSASGLAPATRRLFVGQLAQGLVDFLSPRARLLEAARSVNGEVRVPKLLLLRHLGRDAPLGLLAREVVAPHRGPDAAGGEASV